ncbi:HD domain-containing phosphohydrolase [Desulfovibrio ferrophilus]|uniref:Response regulator n=1 Tax=Desulfovibrio ferrophilus TaxID=241368 RepID=A0A2Z6AVW9_9BACT|nr:HD domain-containing phosphohydrolase [Desulfovibrio ferrophilus]BBD07387.1 response regulator [Desulfovibrio ferrophilus]
MPTILFVDENDAVMANLPEVAHDKFELLLATSYEDATKRLKGQNDIAVVVTELNLNGEDGIVFLANARQNSPETVRIIFTAQNDFLDAFNALNTAQAYRFVKKPCPPQDLLKVIAKAVRRHSRKIKERRAARNSLIGSVKALVDILDMVNPEAMGLSKRIRSRVMATGKALEIKPLWQLDLAVTLSHIGCVALPAEILKKIDQGDNLTPEELQIFGMHPRIAANLLANIDQMAPVAEIIRHQLSPQHDKQPLESRIIKIALDLDRMVQKGAEAINVLKHMRAKDKIYDPLVVDAMLSLEGTTQAPEPSSVREICISELEEGMIMAEDMVNKEGTKLLLRGQAVSKPSLIRLQSFYIALGVIEPIRVMAESAREAAPACS